MYLGSHFNVTMEIIIHLLIPVEYLFGFSLYCFVTKVTTPIIIINNPVVSRNCQKQFARGMLLKMKTGFLIIGLM